MGSPIIFFHGGFDPYVAFTLWQAKRANPNSPIWLIGDGTNDLSSLGVRHFDMSRYSAQRDEFVAVYKNLSCHGPEYERVCFERWFYLAAILEQEGIGQFSFADSDYFFLEDLAPLEPGWAEWDIAGAPIWAFAWFARRSLVQEFCDFVLGKYRDPAFVASLEQRFRGGEDFNPPEGIFNVCDMALWRMFFREREIRHLDLTSPRRGLVFDGAIAGAHGFRMRREYKLIEKRPEGYFGLHEASGEWVRFAAMHLNGKYPKRLPPVFTGWRPAVLRACLRPNYRRNGRKLALTFAYWLRTRRWLLAPAEAPLPAGSGRG